MKPKYSFFVLSIFVAPGSTNIHFSCSREHKYSVWLVIYNICVRGICVSSIDMYNNDVGKKSAQKIVKQTGDLKAATLYFAS